MDAHLDKLPQHERKPKRVSPTQRTLARFRQLGFPAAIVEKFNPFVKVRQDLWGVFDILVLDGQPGVLAVQTTSGEGGNVSSRIGKILAAPVTKVWLEAGNRIEVHGWAKRGGRGERKVWTLRVVPVTLPDLKPEWST